MSDRILPSRGIPPTAQGGISMARTKFRGGEWEVVIAVRPDAMKAMRWLAGDRVALRIEPTSRTIRLRRHPHGFKLSARGVVAKKAAGRAVSCSFKIWQDFVGAHNLPVGPVALSYCHHDSEDLVMPFPVEVERTA
jgi:hypothetical protein